MVKRLKAKKERKKDEMLFTLPIEPRLF